MQDRTQPSYCVVLYPGVQYSSLQSKSDAVFFYVFFTMGSGSSVVVHQPHITDSHFKQLLSSKAEREKLFEKIALYQPDGHIALKGKISLKKLVAYFSDESHALYPGFDVNVDILNEAYKFTNKLTHKHKGKKATTTSEEQITVKAFHKFLPLLLLFDRLWDLFDAADKNVIEDKRVFKGEFVGMYSKLHSLADIVVLGTLTKEQWEAEFALLDKNGDGFINFTEFCTYCVAHIERPFDFPTGDDGADGEEGEDHDQEKEGSALILLHSNTGKTPISGESAIEAVMAAEAAQAAADAANEAAAAAAAAEAAVDAPVTAEPAPAEGVASPDTATPVAAPA
jgi:Ca2+-binding EF-hand superfamily protein